MSAEELLRSLERLREAELALETAKQKHQEEFCVALVKLFNDFGLCVCAGGSEGSRLEIYEVARFTREQLDL